MVISYGISDFICKLPLCLITLVNNNSIMGFAACEVINKCKKIVNIAKVIQKISLIINFFILHYFNTLFRKKIKEFFKNRYYRDYFRFFIRNENWFQISFQKIDIILKRDCPYSLWPCAIIFILKRDSFLKNQIDSIFWD